MSILCILGLHKMWGSDVYASHPYNQYNYCFRCGKEKLAQPHNKEKGQE